MSINQNKKFSSFYKNEMTQNIVSLVFSFLIFITSTIVLIHTSTTNNSFILILLSIVGFVFSIAKIIKSVVLIKKLQELIIKFGELRSNIYIYINWHERKASTPIIGVYFFGIVSVLFAIYGILYSVGASNIPRSGFETTIIIFISTIIIIFISTIYNYQQLQSLVSKHKEFIKIEDHEVEIRKKVQLTKSNYLKVLIYTFLAPTGILLFPKIREQINNKIDKK